MLPALLRRLQYVFWCGGVLLCCLALGKYFEMRHFQATENRRLEEALRGKLPIPSRPSNQSSNQSAVPGGASRKAGSPLGRIEIPRLNLSAIVVEGSDSHALNVGVGRIPQTSEPGQAGNVVLGGHRDTFFRPLSGIRTGDIIKIVTPEGSYHYSVDWTEVVDPENTAPLKATARPSLTLVTCYPFHYVGPAPRRFIVRAHQEVSQAVALQDFRPAKSSRNSAWRRRVDAPSRVSVSRRGKATRPRSKTARITAVKHRHRLR